MLPLEAVPYLVPLLVIFGVLCLVAVWSIDIG